MSPVSFDVILVYFCFVGAGHRDKVWDSLSFLPMVLLDQVSLLDVM